MNFLDISLSVITLTILEIVLGIDNLVFLSILTEKLPKSECRRARFWGLSFAWITRLILLASAAWIVHLTNPFIVIYDITFSMRDLFLLIGGLFLIMKATEEIHYELVDKNSQKNTRNVKTKTFSSVVIQIALMDVIFSFDSVLTAIGLTSNFWVMSVAISISIIIMLYASNAVSKFIEKNPTIKMLALSFLILIGMLLISDSFAFHVPRGYLYFAMGFSLSVEMLNLWKSNRNRI